MTQLQNILLWWFYSFDLIPLVQYPETADLLISENFHASNPANSYVAAVAEYYPLQGSNYTAEERTVGNVRNYFILLNEISTLASFDVVVFPEGTISAGASPNNRTELLEHATLVPDPSQEISVCYDTSEEYSQFFVDLSCGAKTFHTYLIANLYEKDICTRKNCASDGFDVYNTNAVFDRNGTLIAKYRKYNLFGEYWLNSTNEPEIVTFTTDFNVTFGLFTCFDLLFDTPTNLLINDGITDFIFPTMWFSELPFLNSLQAQEQWAYENDVNMLSSGANNPAVGSGGTGIYQGKFGAHYKEIIASGGSKIFVANVFKKNARNMNRRLPQFETILTNEEIDEMATDLDNFYLLRDDLSPYTIKMIDTTKSSNLEDTICNGGKNDMLCCYFNISIAVDSTVELTNHSYYYALVSFNGVRSFSGKYNGGIETCGLISCNSSSIDGCGYKYANYSTISWPVTFETITIVGHYKEKPFKNQYPNSLMTNLRALPTSYYEWSYENTEETTIKRHFKLIKPTNRLLTFAIYGRDYSKDSCNYYSSGSYFKASLFIVYFLLMFTNFYEFYN